MHGENGNTIVCTSAGSRKTPGPKNATICEEISNDENMQKAAFHPYDALYLFCSATGASSHGTSSVGKSQHTGKRACIISYLILTAYLLPVLTLVRAEVGHKPQELLRI